MMTKYNLKLYQGIPTCRIIKIIQGRMRSKNYWFPPYTECVKVCFPTLPVLFYKSLKT